MGNQETVSLPMDYELDDYGLIVTPGKFEGEPLYVPYFWDFVMDGFSELDDDGGADLVPVEEPDIATFPQLKGYTKIRLWVSDSGFVFHDLIA